MSQVAEIFLGILTAMGGFVEIGELTFTVNAGTRFGYQLLWVVALGTIGIIVYCEMAGRIAAVRHRPVFSIIRERVGFKAGLATLVTANAVCMLTCAAEIGGIALLWQLLSDWPYRPLLLAAMLFLVLTVWTLPFQWIERVFGLGGLLMIVFGLTLLKLGPNWGEFATGFVPHWPRVQHPDQIKLYFYYAVALASSVMLPYETYFYAAGGIEDNWHPSDIRLNRVIAYFGLSLGSLLAISLVGVGTEFFATRTIDPQLPGSAVLATGQVYGRLGVLLGICGMFFAFAGAAIETALSAAYNLAQFAGWPWGKHRRPRDAGRFTLTWIAVFVVGMLVVMTGADPIQVVEYSIIFSVVVLPFTYFPVLMVARDKRIMGVHANGRFANALGWFYLIFITAAALAAIPLFLMTHGGQG
jgi:manganese transport protein